MLSATPEFEDCLRLSAEVGVPVKLVQADAVRAWMARQADASDGVNGQ